MTVLLSLRFLQSQLFTEHIWSPWQPLQESWNVLSTSGGLYRIRLNYEAQWLYLGQSSHLRNRVKMLRNVFRDEMPYAAPHTAGPALYAYRHLYSNATLEVSICALDIPEQTRLSIECLAIAIHRQMYQQSPRCQFGRMPVGWKKSSGNSAQLVASGKRFRGGLTDSPDESHLPDIGPLAPLMQGDVGTTAWLNLAWSEWTAIPTAPRDSGSAVGIYCISSAEDTSDLLFIGHGNIAQRLVAYKKRPVLCSWVMGAWYPHQRLALVTDLIASYLLQTGMVPHEQFITTSHEAHVLPGMLWMLLAM